MGGGGGRLHQFKESLTGMGARHWQPPGEQVTPLEATFLDCKLQTP